MFNFIKKKYDNFKPIVLKNLSPKISVIKKLLYNKKSDI